MIHQPRAHVCVWLMVADEDYSNQKHCLDLGDHQPFEIYRGLCIDLLTSGLFS